MTAAMLHHHNFAATMLHHRTFTLNAIAAPPGSTTVLHRRLTCNFAPSPSSPP
eukprot:CAMPEP_0181358344 /NCGR_PEP_ID=MMETSP1106-20121128/5462_1 /TAXON_ID=81844 /ORGANISM="Mantoniella antarctica, Strain SL-175" /LENGTH=52 /DNA_ID=CAMNT_0023471303 /DNA_START=343 /DNA_END=501 /DNA_ORIENTATION=+